MVDRDYSKYNFSFLQRLIYYKISPLVCLILYTLHYRSLYVLMFTILETTKVINLCFTQTLRLKRECKLCYPSISILTSKTLQTMQLHSWTLLGVLQTSYGYDLWHG